MKKSATNTNENPAAALLVPRTLRSWQRKLLVWYDKNKRDLPWRKNRSPYRVWVSEIMLQQTQVTTVIPYFHRFLKAFPTIKALAGASEQEVLSLWEGLGYYRRAKQLHAAAKIIVNQHGGRFPRKFEDVLGLPGIGRYSGGAILSIACDQPQPILEGNTIRLHSRLTRLLEDVKSSRGQNILWKFAESILPDNRVSDFNQALMELGASICKPKNPDCKNCPLKANCQAYEFGDVEKYPVLKPRVKQSQVTDLAVVIARRGKVLMRLCGENEVWSGLWDFPRFRLPTYANANRSSWLQDEVEQSTGLFVGVSEPCYSLNHTVTRYRITLDCFQSEWVQGRLNSSDGSHRWCNQAEVRKLPLSVTGRKIARRLFVGE